MQSRLDKHTRARVAQALLSPGGAKLYIGLALAGLLPIGWATAIGAGHSQSIDASSPVRTLCEASQVFRGYYATPQWLLYPVVLPLGLFLLRRLTVALCGTPSQSLPIVALLPTAPARQRASERFLAIAHDGSTLVWASAAAAVIFAFDVHEVVLTYFDAIKGVPTVQCPQETDWSVMFLRTARTHAQAISIGQNIGLVCLAYLNQAIITIFGTTAIGLIIQHNLAYLRLVYRQSAAAGRDPDDFVALDWDDANYDRCFGLLTLNRSFNAQLYFLVLAGLMMLASRLENVDAKQANALAGLSGQVQRWLFGTQNAIAWRVSDLKVFPDIGQIILPSGWAFCFAVVCMPALLKFLPLFSTDIRQGGIARFLVEFLKPSDPRSKLPMPAGLVDELAGKFSRNSFWPTGDRRAHLLFYFALAVFLILLVPLKPSRDHLAAFGIYVAIALVLAVAGTKILFAALRIGISHFDERLADISRYGRPIADAHSRGGIAERRHHGPSMTMRPGAIFISYASEDVAAARRLRDGLQKAGLDVWLDQTRLEGGDDFDQMIKRNIRQCSLFVPIISMTTQSRQEGYFRLEWNLAVERTKSMADTTPFIIPVVIDPIKASSALVPERFAQVHWTLLPGGEPTEEFASRVQRLADAAIK